MRRRYFDEKGREINQERVALDWIGRNRERAMQALAERSDTRRQRPQRPGFGLRFEVVGEPGEPQRIRFSPDEGADA